MMSVMRSFSKGIVDPPEGAKIVYMDGAWDCFHAGHIRYEECQECQRSWMSQYITSRIKLVAVGGWLNTLVLVLIIHSSSTS